MSATDLGAFLNGTSTDILNTTLPSSHFTDPLLMAGMVVSAFCALSCLVFLISGCIIQFTKHKNKEDFSPFSALFPTSAFLMILYFGLEFAQPLFTELNQMRVIMYFPIRISLSFLGLFAGCWLMSFLLVSLSRRFTFRSGEGTEKTEKGKDIPQENMATLLLQVFCAVHNSIAVGNPICYFYKGYSLIVGEENLPTTTIRIGRVRVKVQASYEALNVSFYGVFLGGAFIFTWLAIRHLLWLKREDGERRKLRIFLPLLITALLLRTGGTFAYSILFTLKGLPTNQLSQLIHTVFYGILSVIIYAAVLLAAGSREWNPKCESLGDTTNLMKEYSSSSIQTDHGKATIITYFTNGQTYEPGRGNWHDPRGFASPRS